MTDYSELKAMALAATPGPWRVLIDDDGNPLSGRPCVDATPELDCGIVHFDGFVQKYWRSARGDREIHANAAFIAAANPQAVLSLIETLEALIAERDVLREALKPLLNKETCSLIQEIITAEHACGSRRIAEALAMVLNKNDKARLSLSSRVE